MVPGMVPYCVEPCCKPFTHEIHREQMLCRFLLGQAQFTSPLEEINISLLYGPNVLVELSSPFNKMSPSATNKGNFQPIDSAVKVLAKQRRRVINNSFESITLQCFVGKTGRGHQRSRWTGAGRQRVK
ncbi:hypothetical protein CDAR_314071 [Caerostris darwini]|uniref:Uncharacterized protein n=1 Tax=Caerostris darwini TaxID=1538125 RepID=A0AAV4N165_9ARAC|nr:hypothetical protein CDAR_314071 [Caerostris darwini]